MCAVEVHPTSAGWVFGVGVELKSSGRRLRHFCISLERNIKKKLSSRRAIGIRYALHDETKNKFCFISVVIQRCFKARATLANLTRRGTSLDEKWCLVVPPCFEPFSIGQLAVGLHLDSEGYFSELRPGASGLATARLPGSRAPAPHLQHTFLGVRHFLPALLQDFFLRKRRRGYYYHCAWFFDADDLTVADLGLISCTIHFWAFGIFCPPCYRIFF